MAGLILFVVVASLVYLAIGMTLHGVLLRVWGPANNTSDRVEGAVNCLLWWPLIIPMLVGAVVCYSVWRWMKWCWTIGA